MNKLQRTFRGDGATTELSTMDLPFSPDMGGKEALSALGYSRVWLLSGNINEVWVKSNYDRESYLMSYTKIELNEGYAAKYSEDAKGDDERTLMMSVQDMQACLKRCQELAGGDR